MVRVFYRVSPLGPTNENKMYDSAGQCWAFVSASRLIDALFPVK